MVFTTRKEHGKIELLDFDKSKKLLEDYYNFLKQL